MAFGDMTNAELRVALMPTDRPCENNLCVDRLLNFQARFCTRCWSAIETCRDIEAQWVRQNTKP